MNGWTFALSALSMIFGFATGFVFSIGYVSFRQYKLARQELMEQAEAERAFMANMFGQSGNGGPQA